MWLQKYPYLPPTKGIFPYTPPPHLSGISSQASYVNLRFWAFENPPPPKEFPIPSVGEHRPLPILDQSVLTIYDDDDDDVNVIFFGVQWLPKRLTPQTSDLEVGVQAFLLGCYLTYKTLFSTMSVFNQVSFEFNRLRRHTAGGYSMMDKDSIKWGVE